MKIKVFDKDSAIKIVQYLKSKQLKQLVLVVLIVEHKKYKQYMCKYSCTTDDNVFAVQLYCNGVLAITFFNPILKDCFYNVIDYIYKK